MKNILEMLDISMENIDDESFDSAFDISRRCSSSTRTVLKFLPKIKEYLLSCDTKELENIRDRIQILINKQKQTSQ